jgi:hypothetical protein
MTLPRERLPYSSPFTRPPLKLPGKARMVIWSVVNIEEWEITRPMARQISQAPMGQSTIPDMPNWTWYEYGIPNKVRARDGAALAIAATSGALASTLRGRSGGDFRRDAAADGVAVMQHAVDQLEPLPAVLGKAVELGQLAGVPDAR